MKRNISNVMRMNILTFYIKWRNFTKQILKYKVIFMLVNEINNEFKLNVTVMKQIGINM